MTTFTEVLPPTKSAPHAAINFTPADPDRPGLRGGLPVAGEIVITSKRTTCRYLVVEFPTGWDGRGFRFAKADGEPGSDRTADGYDVFVGRNNQDRRCGCRGFERWGHCRHVFAAEALLANGWL